MMVTYSGGRSVAISLRVLLAVTVLGTMLGGAGAAWAAPSSPYFTALSTILTTPRSGAVAAPLPDGQVLIAGGASEPEHAELFNPATDTFTALPESPSTEPQVARSGAVAAPLPDGQVLIAGNSAGFDQQSIELFNEATNTFTALPESGDTELQAGHEGAVGTTGAVAAPLPDGQVLIAGDDPQSAELFNPATDTVTALPASGGTETRVNREGAVAAPLPDGQVLIAGGTVNTTFESSFAQNAELFNPVNDTFTALPESPSTEPQVAREDAVAAPLPDGRVLIAGGTGHSGIEGSAELFNPVNDTFTALPESPSTELQTTRWGALAAALSDGRVLIAGGITFDESDSLVQSAELYYSAAEATVTGGDAFGEQPIGEPSPASTLLVTNVGAQELVITTASLGGADPGDFAIAADACSGRTLAFKQTCTIAARFTPTMPGATTATLTLSDNELSPAAITLRGTGVAARTTTPCRRRSDRRGHRDCRHELRRGSPRDQSAVHGPASPS
jgi:hypothetical protein